MPINYYWKRKNTSHLQWKHRKQDASLPFHVISFFQIKLIHKENRTIEATQEPRKREITTIAGSKRRGGRRRSSAAGRRGGSGSLATPRIAAQRSSPPPPPPRDWRGWFQRGNLGFRSGVGGARGGGSAVATSGSGGVGGGGGGEERRRRRRGLGFRRRIWGRRRRRSRGFDWGGVRGRSGEASASPLKL